MKTHHTYNISRMRTNLRKLWDSHVDEESHYYGYYWYRVANEWCNTIAARYSVSPKVIAGIAAALSPGVAWEINKKDAEQLVRYLCGELGYEPTVSTYYANVRKAMRIWAHGDPELELGGNKTRNFYLCIHNPYDEYAVCIDRHAVKAARGMKKGGGVAMTDKQYGLTSEAYRLEAKSLGLRPMELQAILWGAYKNKVGR